MPSGSFFDDNRSTKRRDNDRRKEEVAAAEERRGADDRRRSTDRRGWPFGLILRTTESHRVIEEWLEDNCAGEWGMGLEDMDEKLAQKSFKVMFALESDKNSFVASFSKR
ncbi:MAG: hypothetical protein HN731_13450 [Rhodospirillaceae bacterium]|nr:hypothetical protein [Rhodospirillaceae bacterium]MBT4937745.1 hypothetical protein [Rhodospirillaceae bacterium]MBT7956194.1 hypothetical protein [Rhodospirillaceae bacterium]